MGDSVLKWRSLRGRPGRPTGSQRSLGRPGVQTSGAVGKGSVETTRWRARGGGRGRGEAASAGRGGTQGAEGRPRASGNRGGGPEVCVLGGAGDGSCALAGGLELEPPGRGLQSWPALPPALPPAPPPGPRVRPPDQRPASPVCPGSRFPGKKTGPHPGGQAFGMSRKVNLPPEVDVSAGLVRRCSQRDWPGPRCGVCAPSAFLPAAGLLGGAPGGAGPSPKNCPSLPGKEECPTFNSPLSPPSP